MEVSSDRGVALDTLLKADLLLLGLVLLRAVISILFTGRLRVALTRFFIQSLLLFGSALAVICPEGGGWTGPGWCLTGLCAFLLLLGLRRRREGDSGTALGRKPAHRVPAPLKKPPSFPG
jgi:hypothetical protein